MDGFDIFLRSWIMAFSLILFIISMMAYSRSREKRLGMVSIVFLLFTIKGLLLSLAIFYERVEALVSDYRLDLALDLVILVFLLLAIWGVPSRPGKGEKR